MMRYVYATLLAVGVTVALFGTMIGLIESSEGGLSEPPSGRVLDFVRVPKEQNVETEDNTPKKPEPPEPPPEDPPPMEMNTTDTADTSGSNMSFSAPTSVAVSPARSMR